MSESKPTIGPVRPKDRIEVIDILRGFALFGVLLVIMSNDQPWWFLFESQWTGMADRAAYHLVEFFAQEKFYTLFSFLFGLGFAIQMGRAESRGVRFFPLYSRRLFVLLLIGLVHYLLDASCQLIIYAVLGFLLFLFRARSPKTILAVAFVCLLIPLVRTL